MVFGKELGLGLIIGEDAVKGADVCCGRDGDMDAGEDEKYEDIEGVGDD